MTRPRVSTREQELVDTLVKLHQTTSGWQFLIGTLESWRTLHTEPRARCEHGPPVSEFLPGDGATSQQENHDTLRVQLFIISTLAVVEGEQEEQDEKRVGVDGTTSCLSLRIPVH
ncbi:hypothetical protein EYF80_015800 [Liparis tanakae]|uniref:Uncharacterized protein n=1 Tax=Liparis tanakae TaxID=230148 RepID=A0A4Z2I7F8_9TELE|nr:hypothetical protein EYF80_015800 [Liparis tanakae]